MSAAGAARVVGLGAVVVLLIAASMMVLGTPLADARSVGVGHSLPPSTLSARTFVAAPPNGSVGPDDITDLSVPGFDHGNLVVWVAFQNHIDPNGTAGTTGGTTRSTVVGYDRATGAVVRSVNVTGKVDGLTADPSMGVVIATDNEDDNSAFNLIYPNLGAVATYTYSPNPAPSGVGGTDSIAVLDGQIYVAHSNPNDTTQATDYRVSLHPATLIAQLTPVFFDDSSATNAVTGATQTMALTDPDTNYAMPPASPRFAGDLATVSQGDGRIIFASHLPGTAHLSELNVTDNVSGNLPPVDGFAVATCGHGTLYVVDNGANTISALDTAGWPAGTVFVGEASDNGNPLLGTLNLATGAITSLGNHFVNPHGLLFVPGHCGGGEPRPHHHGGWDG
ncbi:MAG: hypothetical protein L3K17_08085, partial [Thermoplasmata archaeon]|nr:hypothetical protein [Thermoplasmata archaeon]